MKEIKEMSITLENCEGYTINKKDIKHLFIDDISKCLRYYNGKTYEILVAKNFMLEVLNKDERIIPHYDFSEPFSKRIEKYNDITQVSIKYKDGELFNFYIAWNEENEFNNSYQKTEIYRDAIIINICEDIDK